MSNSQACIIETSSMTRMSVSWILRRRRDRMSLSSGSVSAVATPMPLHEWMVWPLICVEAMPVDAVTATLAPSARALRMNSLSTYVLPAPGAPVRNTFAPAFRIAIASDCSMPSSSPVSSGGSPTLPSTIPHGNYSPSGLPFRS